MFENRWRSSCRGWVPCLAASKRVVMVGISGVGKTTLLDTVVNALDGSQQVTVVSFGTVMLEEARRQGIVDRDVLRSLPAAEQIRLQTTAAERIAATGGDVVIVDTHAFVNTSFGYYPGLPERVLRIINPTSYISVSANPEEIYRRRMNDTTRSRDHITVAGIKQELDMQAAMVSACAVISGAPVKLVVNRDGRVDGAADDVIRAAGLSNT